MILRCQKSLLRTVSTIASIAVGSTFQTACSILFDIVICCHHPNTFGPVLMSFGKVGDEKSHTGLEESPVNSFWNVGSTGFRGFSGDVWNQLKEEILGSP